MKIESPSFTEADYHAIMGGYLQRERDEIVTRLGRIADQVDELAPSLTTGGSADDPSWNAVETLVHMASAAQFFGWVIHEVSQKHEIGEQMLGFMNLRDPAIVEAVNQEPTELAGQLRQALERTVRFLERTDVEELRNAITFAGRELTAADFARISVTHHLEDHLEQMRAALAAG